MENNYLEIEYVNEEKGHYSELVKILGREDFQYAGSRKSNNRRIETFIMDNRTWITEKQEEEIKELLGENLRQIQVYRILNYKYYNHK